VYALQGEFGEVGGDNAGHAGNIAQTSRRVPEKDDRKHSATSRVGVPLHPCPARYQSLVKGLERVMML